VDEFAIVWGSEPPAFSIGYEREKIAPTDSGFTVLFADAPDPDEVDDPSAHPDIGLVHLHHLLEEDPDLARGLDIAFEYGVADLDDGTWVVGDLNRLIDG
jgi:hypothetical protein